MSPSDPFFKTPDDCLNVSYGKESRIHRIVFTSKYELREIDSKSNIFRLLKEKINWDDRKSLNFFKNEVFTLGLSKNGKIVLYIKVKPENFAKEFIRSMRRDFDFTDPDISFLAQRLNCTSIEISTDINDPLKVLKNAKLKAKLVDLRKEVLAFLDESMGTTEIELKGDPELTSNLNFLLKDKIQATKYFYKLTKTLSYLVEHLISLEKRLEVQINQSFILLSILLEVDESTEPQPNFLEKSTELPNQNEKKKVIKNSLKK